MHGRRAEVGENRIHAIPRVQVGEHARQACEIGMLSDEHVIPEAFPAQTLRDAVKLQRVHIQRDHPPAWRDGAEKFPGVPAVAEGAVRYRFARLNRQHGERFLHHHRTMPARRRLAGCHLIFVPWERVLLAIDGTAGLFSDGPQIFHPPGFFSPATFAEKNLPPDGPPPPMLRDNE